MSQNTLSSAAPVITDPFLSDSNYRAEARESFIEYINSCYEETKKAGATPPQELPTLDDKTVTGLVANMLGLNRWLLTYDRDTMKQHITLVPPDAVLLTKEQIKDKIGFILPGYRLIDCELYNRLTAKSEEKSLLNVDFSHQISIGHGLKSECFCTLKILKMELTGIIGAITHLLQTTVENKLGAAIATSIAQELEGFGSLLNGDWEDSLVDRLRASHAELKKMYDVLDEWLDNSESNQFCYILGQTTYKRLRDIEAVLNAYCEQSKKAEVTAQAEELAMNSGAEGGAA